jgi:hypothetical protein
MTEGIHRVQLSERTRLPDGRIVTLQLANETLFRALLTKKPGRVALHEASHTYVAWANGTGIKFVSIVPGEGYSGVTVLTREDVVAAGASIAGNHGGTSGDEAIIKQRGRSVSHVAGEAGRIMQGKDLFMYAIACLLEEKRTITGSEVHQLLAVVSAGPSFIVTIEDPKDEKKKKTMNAKGKFTDSKGRMELRESDLPKERF